MNRIKDLPLLTEDQALIIMAYTGVITCEMRVFHKFVEELLERSVYLHELAEPLVIQEIRMLVNEQYLSRIPGGPSEW